MIKKGVGGRLIHIIIASPLKNTFIKMPIHGSFDKKIQKEAFLGGKEGGGFGSSYSST